MRMNWRILGPLALVGSVLFVLTPQLRSLLPVLVMAACPLSMAVMMRRMSAQPNSSEADRLGGPQPVADDRNG